MEFRGSYLSAVRTDLWDSGAGSNAVRSESVQRVAAYVFYLWTDDRDDGLCSEISVAATGNPCEKDRNCYAGGAHRM